MQIMNKDEKSSSSAATNANEYSVVVNDGCFKWDDSTFEIDAPPKKKKEKKGKGKEKDDEKKIIENGDAKGTI